MSTIWRRRILLLSTMLFFAVTAATAYAQDSPLKAEIAKMKATFAETQAVAKNEQDFEVHTIIENTGKEDRFLYIAACTYPEQWIADNPAVHIKHVFCERNPSMDILLKPGETYPGNVSLRISLPVSELKEPSPVRFRLGFNPLVHSTSSTSPICVARNGPTISCPPPLLAPVPPIWSNAITVSVTAATESPLKVVITTPQAAVKNEQDFDVSTKIENIGKEYRLIVLTSQCGSAQDWTGLWASDNSLVRVNQPADDRHIRCIENPLVEIGLKPGETYEGTLSLHASLPTQKSAPSVVSFRLGFTPSVLHLSGIVKDGVPEIDPPPPPAPVLPIWSNTMTIPVAQ